MADFLANLAARSLDQLPSVRPRNPSRYESDVARGQEGPLDELDLELDPVRRPATRHAAPRTMRETGPENAEFPASSDRSHLEVDGETPRTVADVVEHVREAAGPGAIAEPPDEAAPASQAQTRVAASFSPDPQPVIEPGPETISTTDLERASASPPQASRESGPPAVAAVRVERLKEVVSERAVVSENATLPDRTRRAADSSAGTLRVATRIAAPSSADDAPRSSEPVQAAPQVTVSIGRIEVKAAPRPEPVWPVQPAARPEPALSLGEYLERSRKGRR